MKIINDVMNGDYKRTQELVKTEITGLQISIPPYRNYETYKTKVIIINKTNAFTKTVEQQ